MKHTRAALVAGLTLTAASVGAFVPAHAADTTVTFTLDVGGLSISAPASKSLGAGGTAALTQISGSLGSVTVTDTRGLLVAPWTTTVSASDFTSGSNTISKAQVGYTFPLENAFDTTSVVVTPTSQPSLTTNATVVGAGVGANSATWDPTVTVTVPPGAVAGTYTGTITHSVA